MSQKESPCTYRVRAWRRIGLLDMTWERYAAWCESLDHRCMCCSKQVDPFTLHVDHNHDTGKTRGLLCTGCNTGIGGLGDTIIGCVRAIWYLLKT